VFADLGAVPGWQAVNHARAAANKAPRIFSTRQDSVGISHLVVMLSSTAYCAQISMPINGGVTGVNLRQALGR
jgi:hypothetical protein